jgi:hypothetical protein
MDPNVPPPEPISPNAESTSPPLPKINWLVFFILLLAPAVLTLFAASAKADGLAVGCPLFGGGMAGIACGTILARRVGRTLGGKVLLGVVFAALLGLLSFGLGFAGCMLGGFKLDFR